MILEVLIPVFTQSAIGVVGGFITGYAVKKAAKIAAIILALGFIFFQYLAFRGILQLNYEKIWFYFQRFANKNIIPRFLVVNLPFSASFILGLILGFKFG